MSDWEEAMAIRTFDCKIEKNLNVLSVKTIKYAHLKSSKKWNNLSLFAHV